MMLYCPVCNGRMVSVGRTPVIVPKLGEMRDDNKVLICLDCGAATEVLPTGMLMDFPGWTLRALRKPFNLISVPRRTHSLFAKSELYEGVES